MKISFHLALRTPMTRGPCLFGTLGLILGIGLAGSLPAQAQSIVERYMAEQYRMEAMEVIERQGRTMTPRPVRWVPTAADSLRPEPDEASTTRLASETTEEEQTYTIDDRRVVRRLERSWFESTFDDTSWAFLGATSELTVLDTTRTRTLRARLEAQFGAPTQTLVDHDLDSSREEYVQFEYWIVVNDSIPVKIMDPHGPFDRGLVMMTDAAHRGTLKELRRAVLAPIRKSDQRAPYVDYYFDIDAEQWYRTGYDGDTYFREAVRRQDIIEGRRPQLDASATRSPLDE